MNCPSCGVENSALSQRCSSCGVAFARLEENNTLQDVDPNALPSAGEPSEEEGNKRPGSRPALGGANQGSFPIGGVRPLADDGSGKPEAASVEAEMKDLLRRTR